MVPLYFAYVHEENVRMTGAGEGQIKRRTRPDVATHTWRGVASLVGLVLSMRDEKDQ